jgi:hypothetical protein
MDERIMGVLAEYMEASLRVAIAEELDRRGIDSRRAWQLASVSADCAYDSAVATLVEVCGAHPAD